MAALGYCQDVVGKAVPCFYPLNVVRFRVALAPVGMFLCVCFLFIFCLGQEVQGCRRAMGRGWQGKHAGLYLTRSS